MEVDNGSEPDRTTRLHDRLTRKIDAAIASIERVMHGGGSDDASFAGYSEQYRGKLALVRALVDSEDAVIVPSLDAFAPRGHACREVERCLGLERGGGIATLEELANLGILRRELHNKVHLCPACEHCQINFRETCPVCESLDLDVERLIHHFPCAYSGLESEFRQGLELTCPKCNVTLRQLGQDFERPHDVYVCNTNEHIFEDPSLSGQCLHCAAVFPGREVEVASIHSYRPTHLAVRAVELNRLTGLDAKEILYDARLKLASRDFLVLEIQRELLRLKRYGGSFVTASLHFELHGKAVSVFRELTGSAMTALGELLVSSLRSLDLAARTGGDRLGLLLIETDDAGAEVVRDRLFGVLEELSFRTRTGHELTPVWHAHSWSDGDTPLDEVEAFFADEGVQA